MAKSMEANVLDALVGVDITKANPAGILVVCHKRLQEPGTDCVHLYFGDPNADEWEHEIMVERVESPESLKAKFKQMEARGFSIIVAHGS